MDNNRLFCADNLDVLRRHVATESIDLCYIDPPFNSRRNYDITYNRNSANKTKAQAFTDTWTWDAAARRCLSEIKRNADGIYNKPLRCLIAGLGGAVGQGGLLAYLVNITLRIVEIQRVMKRDGTFYLHCDPTAGHYLKLITDAVFCPSGGAMQNEIIWFYNSGARKKSAFGKRHDVIFRYCKSDKCTFNADELREPYSPNISIPKSKAHYYHPQGKICGDVWAIPIIAQNDKGERLGYPTQKPERLLERIIRASSNAGDTVLDAYCGSGTTLAVAQRLGRRWIGIDIAEQSVEVAAGRVGCSVSR